MNIDERLDRLVDRHEALAQSVELLTKDIAELRAGLRDVGQFVTEVAKGTARLLRIAEMHENRITRPEGGNRPQ